MGLIAGGWFTVGPTAWSYSVLADYTGAEQAMPWEVVSRERLQFDVGHLWGSSNLVSIGVDVRAQRVAFISEDFTLTPPQPVLSLKI